MKKIIILLSTLVLTLSAQDCTPSWCKSNKLVLVEQYICTSRALGSADMLLNEIYLRVMKFKGKEGQEGMWAREVKSNQSDWIKTRNKIEDENEVLGSYVKRIDELYRILKEKQSHSVSVVYDNIKEVYDAIVANKAKDLANLMDFPKSIIIDGKERKFKNQKAFLEAYPTIFTKAYREKVTKGKPTKKDMFVNYQGIMLGSGSIWFDEKGHVKSFNTKD